MHKNELVEQIICDVAELPDRTSPEDWPEAMLVTGEELALILERNLSALQPATEAVGQEFLADGTRYKIACHEYAGVGVYGLPLELNGRWVALVAAEDGKHLRAAPSHALPAPVQEAAGHGHYDPSTAPVPPVGHPLQELGAYLADLMDQDQWAKVERKLLAAWAANTAPTPAVASGEAAEPIAVLRRDIGEDTWFDWKPVRPGSMAHLSLQEDGDMDYCEVYAHPAPSAASAAPAWVPVSERLPEPGKGVLLRCTSVTGHEYHACGFHAPKHTLEIPSYDEDSSHDHDEETDTSWLSEGWYESIHNWGDYSSVFIHDAVTHWQTFEALPAAPTAGEK